jgi:ribosomal protein S18 acetylase RimI-like enzyme
VAGDDATIDTVMVPEPALPVEPSPAASVAGAGAGLGMGAGAGAGVGVPVVRRAVAGDVDAMAAQLAETFWDDPVTSHIFKGEKRRDAGLRAYFTTQMRADYLPFGGCYTTDGYAGSAIWAPAGKPLLTGLTALLTMLPVLPYVWNRLPTTLGILNKMESLHPHEPHWYLATLGTVVELQGKGVGSALMRPVLTHCDATGLPCYLESSKERNVPFYRRHGFEVVREVALPDDGPKIWTMWRKPQPVA